MTSLVASFFAGFAVSYLLHAFVLARVLATLRTCLGRPLPGIDDDA